MRVSRHFLCTILSRLRRSSAQATVPRFIAGIVCSGLLSLSLLCASVAGRASSAADKTITAVGFLRKINKGDTLEKVRKVVPAAVRLATPGWEGSEFAMGTYVRTSGKLEGILVFLSPEQRKAVESEHSSDLTDKQKTFHPSDTIETAMLTVAEATGKRSTERIIKQVTAQLGKPASKKYEPEGGPVSGYEVEWKLPGKRSISLVEDSQVHLILSFDRPHRP